MTQRKPCGIHNSPGHQSAVAIRVVCTSLDCDWNGPRVDADGPCPRCGSALIAAAKWSTTSRRRVVVARARFGEPDAEAEARTDAALRRNREDAQR